MSSLVAVCACSRPSTEGGPAGGLDARFGSGGRVLLPVLDSTEARAVAIQPDGKILAAGSTQAPEIGGYWTVIARLDSAGVLDPTFGDGGRVESRAGRAAGIALAGTKLVVAGTAARDALGNGQLFVARHLANGAVDTSFGSQGLATAAVGSTVEAVGIAVDAQGRSVVAGRAWNGSRWVFAVARFDSTGAPDGTFGAAGIVTTAVAATGNDTPAGVALDPDGGIVVGGYSDPAGGTRQLSVVRYLSDGSLDAGFGTGGKASLPAGNAWVTAVLVQGDRKIVLAGQVSAYFGASRLLATGSLDTTFRGTGIAQTSFAGIARAVAIDGSGRIVLAGEQNSSFAVVRLSADGNADWTFGAGGLATAHLSVPGPYAETASSVAVQPDGGIVAAGNAFAQVAVPGAGATPGPAYAVARFRTDGRVDVGFGTEGAAFTGFPAGAGAVVSVAQRPDGGYVGLARRVTQHDFSTGGGPSSQVFALGGDGAVEPSFDPMLSGTMIGVVADGAGTYVTGNVRSSLDDLAACRMDPLVAATGSSSCGAPVSPCSTSLAVHAFQAGPGGSFVAAGTCNDGADDLIVAVRFRADLSPDPGFGAGGVAKTNPGAWRDEARAIAIDTDGRLLVSGSSFNGVDADFIFMRYLGDGTPDTSLSGSGKARTDFGGSDDDALAVALQADGKIVVAGRAGNAVALARYASSGALDATFGDGGRVVTAIGTRAEARAVSIDPDGAILVAGRLEDATGSAGFVARYGPGGFLDAAFGEAGIVQPWSGPRGEANVLLRLPDGAWLVAGSAADLEGDDLALAQLVP